MARKKKYPKPDPVREMTDADFEEMVEYARDMVERPANRRVLLSRFAKIRAFEIDLRAITDDELEVHFAWVARMAKPYPTKE